jgi:hypothetical protein
MPFSFDLGTAGAQRRAPTGGSAKGIPRNWATFGVLSLMKPLTRPDVVLASKKLMACAICKRPSKAVRADNIANKSERMT